MGLREIAFVAHFYGTSPIEVQSWWSKDIHRYYVEAVQLHNEMNRVEED